MHLIANGTYTKVYVILAGPTSSLDGCHKVVNSHILTSKGPLQPRGIEVAYHLSTRYWDCAAPTTPFTAVLQEEANQKTRPLSLSQRAEYR